MSDKKNNNTSISIKCSKLFSLFDVFFFPWQSESSFSKIIWTTSKCKRAAIPKLWVSFSEMIASFITYHTLMWGAVDLHFCREILCFPIFFIITDQTISFLPEASAIPWLKKYSPIHTILSVMHVLFCKECLCLEHVLWQIALWYQ